jgi:hypothetical protein
VVETEEVVATEGEAAAAAPAAEAKPGDAAAAKAAPEAKKDEKKK